MVNRIFIFVIIMGLVSACSYSYKPADETGHFQTSYAVNQNEILVSQPIQLSRYKKLLVVGIKLAADDQVGIALENKFWTNSIQSLNVFNNVVPANQLSSFLAQQGINQNILAGYNLDALHQVQADYGNFLVTEIYTVCSDGCHTTFKVIDPKDGKVYFMVKHNVANFGGSTSQHTAGWDSQMLYPILNAFADWLHQNN